MGQKLTQPEEIDQILKDFAGGDAEAGAPAATEGYFSKMHKQAEVTPSMGVSNSAYRAAYMKSQNLGS